VINKALYGLRTSGKYWHEQLADCLRDLGFQPCVAESDMWLRANHNVYKYIGIYVDDLAIVAKDPQSITDKLTNYYKFKLKLGIVVCLFVPKQIESSTKQEESVSNITVHNSKQERKRRSSEQGRVGFRIECYQSLIGSLQWAVPLGCMEIATAVMTMSSFRAAPQVGHLECVKRIIGYVSKMCHAAIHVQMAEPDLSSYDWMHTIYGDCQEVIPADAPPPLGHYVTTSHYVNANLMHDLVTGKSVTGCIHFFNRTLINAYTKKQATAEMATYGSVHVHVQSKSSSYRLYSDI
jgi:Reverse transcriptase (RNA-dependent DNA polymerase)